jgi:hypothetical protein
MSTATAPFVETGFRQASHWHGAKGEAGARLVLETALGLTPDGFVAHPVFFDGQPAHPDVAAFGLRALVEVASTRYFDATARRHASLDPILTAHGDMLRCESFSACNGVYARLDLFGQALGGQSLGLGTTNIDINAPLAASLAAVLPSDALRLQVGAQAVVVTTEFAAHTERAVALPERWVRALAEAQCMASGLKLQARLDSTAWRRFVASLSTAGGSGPGVQLWALPLGNSNPSTALRAALKPAKGAVCLSGTARLGAARQLAHLIQEVQVFGPDVDDGSLECPSVWVFGLPGARLSLMLSPQPWRGFSGEGAVLAGLAQPGVAQLAQTVSELLAWEGSIDIEALGQAAKLTQQQTSQALDYLATSGQVGFDVSEGCYFHRLLPFNEDRLRHNYPRLKAAQALVDAGQVAATGSSFEVQGTHARYCVDPPQESNGTWRCTCIFHMRYLGSRGPCKHILAGQIFSASR